MFLSLPLLTVRRRFGISDIRAARRSHFRCFSIQICKTDVFGPVTGRSPEPTIPCKSSAPANPRPPCGEELPRSVRFVDCTIRSASHLRASDNTHAGADGAAGIHASRDRYRLAQSVCQNTAKPVLAAIFQNQLNRSAQAFTALFHGTPLAIGAGDLRGPGDKPIVIPLDDRCEFIAHGKSIERKRPIKTKRGFNSPRLPGVPSFVPKKSNFGNVALLKGADSPIRIKESSAQPRGER